MDIFDYTERSSIKSVEQKVRMHELGEDAFLRKCMLRGISKITGGSIEQLEKLYSGNEAEQELISLLSDLPMEIRRKYNIDDPQKRKDMIVEIKGYLEHTSEPAADWINKQANGVIFAIHQALVENGKKEFALLESQLKRLKPVERTRFAELLYKYVSNNFDDDKFQAQEFKTRFGALSDIDAVEALKVLILTINESKKSDSHFVDEFRDYIGEVKRCIPYMSWQQKDVLSSNPVIGRVFHDAFMNDQMLKGRVELGKYLNEIRLDKYSNPELSGLENTLYNSDNLSNVEKNIGKAINYYSSSPEKPLISHLMFLKFSGLKITKTGMQIIDIHETFKDLDYDEVMDAIKIAIKDARYGVLSLDERDELENYYLNVEEDEIELYEEGTQSVKSRAKNEKESNKKYISAWMKMFKENSIVTAQRAYDLIIKSYENKLSDSEERDKDAYMELMRAIDNSLLVFANKNDFSIPDEAFLLAKHFLKVQTKREEEKLKKIVKMGIKEQKLFFDPSTEEEITFIETKIGNFINNKLTKEEEEIVWNEINRYFGQTIKNIKYIEEDNIQ